MIRNWSIPAGRIFGVSIRIHLTFFFLLIFVWMTESLVKGGAGVARGLALVAMIFGSVILHELGHALVALHSGVPVRSIILLPIGGITLMDETAAPGKHDPGRDIRIARWSTWCSPSWPRCW